MTLVAVSLVVATSMATQLTEGSEWVTLVMTVPVVLLAAGALLRGTAADRALGDILLALGALAVFGGVSALLTSMTRFMNWVESVPPAVGFLTLNSMKLSSVAVLLIIMAVYRWRRQDLLLQIGDPNAATAIPKISWRILGAVVALVVTVLFLTDPAVLSTPLDVAVRRVLPVAGFIVLGPVINAVCEELLYRHALVQTMQTALGTPTAILLSSLCFGLAHITGSPYGLVGVVCTGLYGVVSALAMYRTRGAVVNTAIHVVADLAVVLSLTVTRG